MFRNLILVVNQVALDLLLKHVADSHQDTSLLHFDRIGGGHRAVEQDWPLGRHIDGAGGFDRTGGRLEIRLLRIDRDAAREAFGYKILVKQVRERGAAVPPLVNAYMNLSPTLRSFGTALNPGFGEVEETGILMTISDMFEEKVKRHLIYDQNAIPEHLKMPFYAN